MRSLPWFVLLVGVHSSCGCSDGTSEGGGVGGAGGGSDFASGGAGGTSGASTDLSGTGDDGTGFGREGFRFGINLGHPNPDFGDDDMADLSAAVGAKSIRIKYPEYHFDAWGQDIEVGDAQHYASLGMKDHAAFVLGMTEAHSTAPSGSENWERDYYIPKNLYEPIFDTEGAINPNNYYATYLAGTFETYKTWVKYWEIFNEPDWVSDWQVTQTWGEAPPGQADELVRFHGTIFDYIRMLRIASAVRDVVAPGTFVMTGGLGYASFLDAILRYTDNPDDGAVTEQYPMRGGEYFDVLSIHHYPHLVEAGNSDAALQSLRSSRDAFQAVLDAASVSGKGWMVTESGAAHTAIADAASGPDYARNYLQKSYVWAKAEGFLGIDWFVLSDGADVTNPFEQMGLYSDVSALGSTSEAEPTGSGLAYRTTSEALAGARLDLVATAALELPPNARGYVFREEEAPVYVLWAEAEGGEGATATVSIETAQPLTPTRWDGSTEPTLAPSNGAVTVAVTSSPVILRE